MNSEQEAIGKSIVSKNASHGPLDLDKILTDFGISLSHDSEKYIYIRNLLDEIIAHKNFENYNAWITHANQKRSLGKNTYVKSFSNGIKSYIEENQKFNKYQMNEDHTIALKGKTDSISSPNNALVNVPKIKEASPEEQKQEIEKLTNEKNELEKENLKKIITKEASEASSQMEKEMMLYIYFRTKGPKHLFPYK